MVQGLTRKTALVVIDLQEAMRTDRDAGYPWANPDAPATDNGRARC